MRAALHVAALAVTLVLGAALSSAGAQDSGPVRRAYVRDKGPGRPGRILSAVLSGPHRLVRASPDSTIDIRRGTVVDTSLVIVGGDITVAGEVRGDVVVIDGDLWLHPGARITGRAIAIGGCAYNSTLGIAIGGRECYRDGTFVLTETASGLAFDYQPIRGPASPPFALAGLYGFGIPAYDRSNGASIPFGPSIRLRNEQFELEPRITYRSHLGAIDPSIEARYVRSRVLYARAFAGRSTFTNDAWIRGNLVNSLTTLLSGSDSRNYYRGDRVEVLGYRLMEGETLELEPYVGVAAERAFSTGPDSNPEHLAWSLFAKDDEEGVRRRNPSVRKGTITSALIGSTLRWEQANLVTSASGRVEVPFTAVGNVHFVQTTVDGKVAFPGPRDHRVAAFLHVVGTLGDTPPPQRFAYIDGSGTLPTEPLLGRGGDQLLFTEERYTVPLERFRVRLLGIPEITLRHMMGGARVGGFPKLEQNLGVRFTLSLIRLDYTINPANQRTDFSIGASISQ